MKAQGRAGHFFHEYQDQNLFNRTTGLGSGSHQYSPSSVTYRFAVERRVGELLELGALLVERQLLVEPDALELVPHGVRRVLQERRTAHAVEDLVALLVRNGLHDLTSLLALLQTLVAVLVVGPHGADLCLNVEGKTVHERRWAAVEVLGGERI